MTDLMLQHAIYTHQFSIHERAAVLQVRMFNYILTIYLLSQKRILSAQKSLKTYPFYKITKLHRIVDAFLLAFLVRISASEN
jgi:hypothetical protein